jgi:hypothetical protein
MLVGLSLLMAASLRVEPVADAGSGAFQPRPAHVGSAGDDG